MPARVSARQHSVFRWRDSDVRRSPEHRGPPARYAVAPVGAPLHAPPHGDTLNALGFAPDLKFLPDRWKQDIGPITVTYDWCYFGMGVEVRPSIVWIAVIYDAW
jgi:hypothetical protein